MQAGRLSFPVTVHARTSVGRPVSGVSGWPPLSISNNVIGHGMSMSKFYLIMSITLKVIIKNLRPVTVQVIFMFIQSTSMTRAEGIICSIIKPMMTFQSL